MLLMRCKPQPSHSKHLFISEDGRPVKDFRARGTACQTAGLPDLRFHDLLRTAARNMIRAGVREKVAMEVSATIQQACSGAITSWTRLILKKLPVERKLPQRTESCTGRTQIEIQRATIV